MPLSAVNEKKNVIVNSEGFRSRPGVKDDVFRTGA